jgi:hypothetical protein
LTVVARQKGLVLKVGFILEALCFPVIMSIESNWEMSMAGIVVILVCYITSE